MEKNYVIQKPSNGSIHPNIVDTIKEAKKYDYDAAHDICLLLQYLGFDVEIANINNFTN